MALPGSIGECIDAWNASVFAALPNVKNTTKLTPVWSTCTAVAESAAAAAMENQIPRIKAQFEA